MKPSKRTLLWTFSSGWAAGKLSPIQIESFNKIQKKKAYYVTSVVDLKFFLYSKSLAEGVLFQNPGGIYSLIGSESSQAHA
jgi:hypothetical protein